MFERPRGAVTRGGAALVRSWLRLPSALRALAPLAIMALLWWSSSRSPTSREPNVARALAYNAMHVVAYGALAAACLLARSRRGATAWRRGHGVFAVAVAVGYGVVDELHQSFVPGRTCSVADVMTDTAGAILVVLVLRPWCGGPHASVRALVWTVVACLVCVAFATWGPW